ncbi:MAG: hypothetical protein RR817_10930 [Niameybacter sp.]
MRIIDCYYIKGYGKESKCVKIHGVGIAYNVARGMVYCKAIGAASGVLSIPPLALAIGLSIGQGFVSSGVQFIKNGGLL